MKHSEPHSGESLEKEQLVSERWTLLHELEEALEWPMVALAVIWLVVMILEFTRGVSPFFERVSQIIWIVFILEFALRLLLAPDKGSYIKRSWLTIVALVLPALRALRFLRIVRVLRGVRLVRVVASANRGIAALRRSMQRRGAGYVIGATIVVLFAGAAGMYEFENSGGELGLGSYGEALWWTAMLLTTIGSDFWPQTPEGRALTVILSLYALGILGYVAGTLATFFIGRDAENAQGEIAGEASLRELRNEIAGLRAALGQQKLG